MGLEAPLGCGGESVVVFGAEPEGGDVGVGGEGLGFSAEGAGHAVIDVVDGESCVGAEGADLEAADLVGDDLALLDEGHGVVAVEDVVYRC